MRSGAVKKLQELSNLGQSIWYDNIRRALLVSGGLQRLIDDGVTGVTSNPSIFKNAIAGSTDYDHAIHELVDQGLGVEEIYEALVLEDIQRGADMLLPVYEQSQGVDGYISLEVNPGLAGDTNGTIAEAKRLFAALDRPNVMIKVPATEAGIPAITALIGEGININVTLIFSLASYAAVAEAYLQGLELLVQSGADPSRVSSVASFFVSRVDKAVDRELEVIDEGSLMGKIAIANSKLAYKRFGEIFSGERWQKLEAKGARVQRPLWASTSTKNPLYADTLYVDALIGPQTINTMPPSTLQAFIDHGTPARTIDADVDQAYDQIQRLAEIGVDLDAITDKLLADGVVAFNSSFQALIASIESKRSRLLAGWEHQSAVLGAYQDGVDGALAEIGKDRIVSRIWSFDHTVWGPDPREITDRLGWLRSPEMMLENLQTMQALTETVRADQYTHALLMGMGGSSLAPEVFRKTFGVRKGFLDLDVLDSTDPAAIIEHSQRLNPAHTLFIVATKSGGTEETLSFFKWFYNWTLEREGEKQAGQHFIAITDPGSKLADLAKKYTFRATFLNDPNIGGRYSALSYFGLVPAALMGLDLELLLARALTASSGCDACVAQGDNPGAWLGVVVGELAKAGRDKLTLVLSPSIESFGNWIEQLVAESTGKDGTGILPVVGEPLADPDAYGQDRLFVHLQVDGDRTQEKALAAIAAAGHPVVHLKLHDRYDLGRQFFLWEMATAIAGQRLGIHPFDQPNVEEAKVQARRMAGEYRSTGQLPIVETAPLTHEALKNFLAGAQPGAYIALQAYIHPTAEAEGALGELQIALRDHTRLATTRGFGPRFLHSTGQLHKGDAGRGLFIQLTVDDLQDVPIPDQAGSAQSSLTFGALKEAQALGDRQALIDAGRMVIRFHLGSDPIRGLRRLAGFVK
ncbi:MAG TPA: bifunctional transaldolase/phosoglucose isomerase [Anaerolineae bacterium]|nr:bifunctional transaldolase/phosoglucose isomerase [Anaerolineae bacterium]